MAYKFTSHIDTNPACPRHYLSLGGIPLFWWLMAYRVVFVGVLA